MQAKQLPAARGWYWFLGGLRLWQRAPGTLGLAALSSFFMSIIIGSVPWLGSLLVCLMGPFLDVLLLRVCQAIASGVRPSPRELRRGLGIESPQRLRGLLVLGVVTFLGVMLSRAVVTLIAGDAVDQLAQAGAAAKSAQSAPAAASEALAAPALAPNVLLAVMFNLAGIFVLSIIMWIAPALTAFADLPPVKSLVFSVVACWRNKGAFLVFGLALGCMSVPLSLIMLVGGGFGQMLVMMIVFGILMPACFASNYLSIVDIFGGLPELPAAGRIAGRDHGA